MWGSDILRGLYHFLPAESRRDIYRFRRREQYDAARTAVTTAGQGADAITYTLRSFDEHRCIFVHVPKTAGISVARALFGNAAGSHEAASDYRLIFGRDFWRYFKFAFVRNPYARLVSAYEFLMRGGFRSSRIDQQFRDEILVQFSGFEDFVLRWLKPRKSWPLFHFQPQTEFLTLDGELVMDFIGRYERLSEDFAFISDRLRLGAQLPHLNRTDGPRKPLASYFRVDGVMQRVRDVYAADFEMLQYPTILPAESEQAACGADGRQSH
ncbi:MAG: sulfotransferase family 2 domain-containing protein [Thermoguttaceae bacterium]